MRQAVVTPSCAVILLALLAAGQSPSGASGALQQPASSGPARAAFMQHHFRLISEIHDAIVRGDLPEARAHARALAAAPAPEGMPPAAAPYVESLRRTAGRAASVHETEDVTAASAAMLAACGDCHRAVGTMPAMPAPAAPEVGGLVGHMLAHEAAAELLVQGLTVPSASLWQQGAVALAKAPLGRSELPPDPKLTRAIAAEEERVHELASRALEAADQRSRIYVYSELMQSCSACHALHGGVWGPDRK